MNLLIVGGSGGIGAALVRQCIATYPEATIHATYLRTKPILAAEQLRWYQLDACVETEVAALAAQLGRLDMLINAVGLLHSELGQPEKSIKQFDVAFWQQNIEVNVLPTLLLAKHFAEHLRPENTTNNSHFVALSARIGSIKDNRLGGWHSYRCSKAALNMALKNISIEWQQKRHNCCVIAFHPGTTDTSLSQPFQRNILKQQLFSADVVASKLLMLRRQLSVQHSGRFYDYDGREISW